MNAPCNATGPLPPDVPPDLFPGPYYEWWNAKQVTFIQSCCACPAELLDLPHSYELPRSLYFLRT